MANEYTEDNLKRIDELEKVFHQALWRAVSKGKVQERGDLDGYQEKEESLAYTIETFEDILVDLREYV
jgi:hypothetical protein